MSAASMNGPASCASRKWAMVPLLVNSPRDCGCGSTCENGFAAIGLHVPAQRIEPAHQRTIRMHCAALTAEEDARSGFGLPQNQPCAVLGPGGPKFRRGQAAIAREARNLIGIELN